MEELEADNRTLEKSLADERTKVASLRSDLNKREMQLKEQTLKLKDKDKRIKELET